MTPTVFTGVTSASTFASSFSADREKTYRAARRAMYLAIVRSHTLLLGALLATVPACKKKPPPDHVPVAELAPQMAQAEAAIAAIKKLPTSPPPFTRAYGPPDAIIGEPARLGMAGGADPYMIVHVEDMTAPRFYAGEKVQVRITDSSVLSSCSDGVDQVKTAKDGYANKGTFTRCTGFKYAFVVKTTEYVRPKLTTVSDKTVGNTRTIGHGLVPGRVVGEVTIYSLADGKEVGAFRFAATSSDKPSTEGGFDGAVDRDLKQQADNAIRRASADKNQPPPPAPSAPKVQAGKKK